MQESAVASHPKNRAGPHQNGWASTGRSSQDAAAAAAAAARAAGGGSGGEGGGGIAGGHGAIMLVEPEKKNDPAHLSLVLSPGLPLCKVKWTWLVDKNSKVTVSLRWVSVSACGSLGLSAEEE